MTEIKELFGTFVCGNDSKDGVANDADDTTNDNIKFSKESQVAALYRKKVYHPFIRKIRKDKYSYDGDDNDVPTHLTAISWMDGCVSQLKLITSPHNMQLENDMEIR